MQHAHWLQQFIDVYTRLGTDNLDTLEAIYHPQVTFIDPLHQLTGYQQLEQSFRSSYTHVMACQFDIGHVLATEQEAAVYWSMTFQHKHLNGKSPIVVQGHSHLKEQDGRIIYHRDYLDVGAMIYEHIPVIGGLIQRIKKRAGQPCAS